MAFAEFIFWVVAVLWLVVALGASSFSIMLMQDWKGLRRERSVQSVEALLLSHKQEGLCVSC